MNPKLTLTALASVAVLSGCYYVPYGYGYPGYPGYPAYPAVGTAYTQQEVPVGTPGALRLPRRPPATNTPSRNRLSRTLLIRLIPRIRYYPAYPYAYPYAGYPYYGYGYGYPSISVGFGYWAVVAAAGAGTADAWRRMARRRQWLARRWRT